MKRLDARLVLERMQSSRCPAFAFDFDGTLAPIVETPARARMPAATRKWLTVLARRHPVAIVSGRRLADLEGRVPNGLWLVGNHGLEEQSPDGREQRWDAPDFRWGLEVVRQCMVSLIRRWRGSFIEWKELSFTLHYRRADPRLARPAKSILEALLLRFPSLELRTGRKVLEVRPAGLGDKGDAVRRLRARWGADFFAYFGDDATDEDAFAALGGKDLAVRVGMPKRDTLARCFVKTPGEISLLLRALVR